MKRYEEYLQVLREDFKACIDPMERLELLIDCARDCREISDSEKNEDTKVPGCVSHTYLKLVRNEDNSLELLSDSDALTIKGYLGILSCIMQNCPIEEASERIRIAEEFAKECEIQSHLTPNRANAFANITKLMRTQKKELVK